MKKILVGLDGSSNSFKALEEAIDLAKFYNAELHTISVEELPRYSDAVSEIDEEKESEDSKYHAIIQKAIDISEKKEFKIETHIVEGHEVKSIIEFIKEYKYDMLIIGFIGTSAIYEHVIGSTCSSLVRLTPCSVLVVK